MHSFFLKICIPYIISCFLFYICDFSLYKLERPQFKDTEKIQRNPVQVHRGVLEICVLKAEALSVTWSHLCPWIQSTIATHLGPYKSVIVSHSPWSSGSCTALRDFSSLKCRFHYVVDIFFPFFWTPGEHHLSFVPNSTPISVWRITSALLCVVLVLWKCRRFPFTTVTERIRVFYSLLRYSQGVDVWPLFGPSDVPFRDLESWRSVIKLKEIVGSLFSSTIIEVE